MDSKENPGTKKKKHREGGRQQGICPSVQDKARVVAKVLPVLCIA